MAYEVAAQCWSLQREALFKEKNNPNAAERWFSRRSPTCPFPIGAKVDFVRIAVFKKQYIVGHSGAHTPVIPVT